MMSNLSPVAKLWYLILKGLPHGNLELDNTVKSADSKQKLQNRD